MQEAVSRTPLGSRLFLITSSSPIRRSAEKLGFEIVNTGMYSGLSEWAHDIGLGDRLPDSAKGSGEPTFVEDVRSLFIRP